MASTVSTALRRARATGGRHLHLRHGAPTRYAISSRLGEGTFATVHLCTDLSTGRPHALKTVDKSLGERFQGLDRAIEMEMEIMRHVGQHPHIAGLVDSFETPDSWGLVLELASGQQVFDRLEENGPFSDADAGALARQVAQALQHIHDRGVCHRDVKPENILYTSSSPGATVQLCDFGVSLPCDGPLRGQRGTLAYMAPEMLVDGAEYGKEVDLWGLGVVLYEVLSGANPFDPFGDASEEEVTSRIKGFTLDALHGPEWAHVSAEAKAVVRGLLQRDPSSRLSAEQVLCFPWVCLGGAAPRWAQSFAASAPAQQMA